jgi:hypothetical protein
MPSSLAERLVRRFATLDRTRRSVESLVVRGELSRRAAERVYEATFLNACTLFEAFLEDSFVAKLVTGTRTRARPRAAVASHRVARELVYGSRPYVDWLPYEKTESRARVFFRGGRPFSGLNADDIRLLRTCVAIRNAIAHRSRESRRRFLGTVRGLLLPPRERTPAAFLRSQLRAAPPQTRYEDLLASLAAVARKLV